MSHNLLMSGILFKVSCARLHLGALKVLLQRVCMYVTDCSNVRVFKELLVHLLLYYVKQSVVSEKGPRIRNLAASF